MSRSKKAFLLGETVVKILVAVVCLFFLVFLAILIYKGFILKNQDLELAKSSLNLVYYRVTHIEEKKSETFLVESPVKWVIVSWPNSELYKKPDSCKEGYEKSCICICSSALTFPGLLENCNKEKNCKDLDKNIFIKDTEIKIDGPIGLNLSLKDNKLTLEKLA